MKTLLLSLSILLFINYARAQSLSDKVIGNYAATELQDYERGKTEKLPSNGFSKVLKITKLDDVTVLITETSILRGKTTMDSYKAKLSMDQNLIAFEEIWEQGAYQANGTFRVNTMQENVVRRLDGKLSQRTIFTK